MIGRGFFTSFKRTDTGDNRHTGVKFKRVFVFKSEQMFGFFFKKMAVVP